MGKMVIHYIAKTTREMAELRIIQFNNWRDPMGYRLNDSKVFVVRNGKRIDNFEVVQPLKNKALYGEFANNVVNAEGVLQFVQRHGPLTDQGNDQGDFVNDVLINAERMRYILGLLSDRRQRAGLGKRFGIPAIPLHVVMNLDQKTRVLRWEMWPNRLLDALWLQVGQAATSGARIQTCALCREFFAAGYPRERRLDSKFCSDEHRVRYNSLKRSWGE